MRKRYFVLVTFSILILSACAPKWTFTVKPTIDEGFEVNQKLLDTYSNLIVEDNAKCEGIPLEIVLYQNGVEVIPIHRNHRNRRGRRSPLIMKTSLPVFVLARMENLLQLKESSILKQ